MTAPLDVWMDRHGVLVCWRGRIGTALASIDSMRAAAAEDARYIAEGGSDAPVVLRHDGQPVCAASTLDGVFSSQGFGPAERVLEGAREAAMTMARGVVVGGVGAWGVRVIAGTELVQLSPRRDAHQLHLVATSSGILAVYALDDDAFGVARLDGDRVTEVRHRLRARPRGLDVCAVRGRVGVSIAYDDEAVDLAVLGSDGAVRERPHAVMRDSGRLTHPSVLFEETAFVVAALDERGAVQVHRVGGGARMFREVRGPYRLAIFRQQIHCVTVDAAQDALVTRELDRDGLEVTHRIDIAPRDAAHRGRVLATRDLVGRVGSRLVGRGYRGESSGAAHESSLGGTLREGERLLRWRVEVPGDGASILHVVVGEGEEAEVPASSLVRLARWMKRGRRAAREAAAADHAWAAAIVSDDARVQSATRTPGGARIELVLDALPSPDALLSWLRAFGAG